MRSFRNADRVGIHNISTRSMIDGSVQHCFQILNQRAIQPDVQSLNTVADRENRLVKVERVLQQKFVDSGATGIGRATSWNPLFAITLGINVKPATREEHTMGSREETRHAVLALME